MGPLESLEKYLVKTSKSLPQLPKNVRKVIVDIAPWMVLVGIVLSLWSLTAIWAWAHVDRAARWANELSEYYGGGTVADTSRMTIYIWLALLVILAEIVLMAVAFSPLKKRQKTGWNILFILSIVYLVYGIVMLFTDYGYGGIIGLFGTIIGTAIGWYILFQVRNLYLPEHSKSKTSN